MTIAEMQQRLLDLGYQPGPADGILGKRTIDALKKYQRDNNLSVTGKLDNKTIINLLK
jgi:peptidoglycan hydrolase-like protein with peptidoglycan-binding domain